MFDKFANIFPDSGPTQTHPVYSGDAVRVPVGRAPSDAGNRYSQAGEFLHAERYEAGRCWVLSIFFRAASCAA